MSADNPFASLGAEFRALWGVPGGSAPTVDHEVDERRVRDELHRQRMDRFIEFCPAEFRQKIDEAKIPNLAAWKRADAWAGSFPGVWLWSTDTGQAKTRMLWRKFGLFHVEHGMSVQRISGLNLAEEYADCRCRAKTADFYRHLCGTDVVMLDDLDKMALPNGGQGFREQDEGAANARMLRELFDAFYERRRPVLVTTNRSIEWFGERIGDSCERRMRAVCAEIDF